MNEKIEILVLIGMYGFMLFAGIKLLLFILLIDKKTVISGCSSVAVTGQ
jgi:hypothetical protein